MLLPTPTQIRVLSTMFRAAPVIKQVSFSCPLQLADSRLSVSLLFTGNGKSREGMKSHMLSRNQKLKAQGAEAQTGIFKGVRA